MRAATVVDGRIDVVERPVPKPGAGRAVTDEEWLRTITSAPSNAFALCISVFAAGGIISSPGVP